GVAANKDICVRDRNKTISDFDIDLAFVDTDIIVNKNRFKINGGVLKSGENFFLRGVVQNFVEPAELLLGKPLIELNVLDDGMEYDTTTGLIIIWW
ncbi:hypothetical protein N9N67_12405, partial [Bacteriovoracaceae bacterium]|nr:hypothetical protein [Bacteriovoracaceae bacterium]